MPIKRCMNLELGFEMYLTYLKTLKQNGLFLFNEVFDYLFQCSVIMPLHCFCVCFTLVFCHAFGTLRSSFTTLLVTCSNALLGMIVRFEQIAYVLPPHYRFSEFLELVLKRSQPAFVMWGSIALQCSHF